MLIWFVFPEFVRSVCVLEYGHVQNKTQKSLAYFMPLPYEPRREKTGFLHMRKRRRRSNQYLCFRYTDSTIPLLPKSEISSL